MSGPYFSININMDGLAVEDVPTMLDIIAAAIRKDSFAQVDTVYDRNGRIVGSYLFDWGE